VVVSGDEVEDEVAVGDEVAEGVEVAAEVVVAVAVVDVEEAARTKSASFLTDTRAFTYRAERMTNFLRLLLILKNQFMEKKG